MNRKYLLLLFVVLSLSLKGQSIKDEIQVMQGMYGIEKKKILEQAMQLSETEATQFWTIYEAYEEKRKKLGADRLLIISDYATSYASLGNTKADEIATRCFANDFAIEKLHREYYKKVKKSISALRAAQFMQLESYLQNVVRVQLQNQIPFIGELVPAVDNRGTIVRPATENNN